MAANAKSIAFGDFSYYTVRDVMAASLFRFTDSAYTKLGQVGFLQWSRHGGNLLDVAAVKLYQNSAA
jgi:HK97 family phage major capsid protein